MTICSARTVIKHCAEGFEAATLKCRSWTCEQCRPMRRRQLIAKCFSGNPDTFITLTVNPAVGLTPEGRAWKLARAWRLIRKRAKRQFGIDALPFIAVVEKTEAGEPHLHILARLRWLPKQWLSDQMRELMQAPIVDIRRPKRRGKVAAYVCKYAGKAAQKFATTKRYWCSPDWQLETYEPSDGPAGAYLCAEISLASLGFTIHLWSLAGYRVHLDGERAWCRFDSS